ncbi:MAG: hypothetical protein KDD82_16135 [Planctomycetes bacterium]|nr:hypothetical protein [Planctomycetota bacterium]
MGPLTCELAVPRFEQPDDVTCGPTCLMQALRYYGDPTPFEEIVQRTPRNPDGGTLGVYLGTAARSLGYAVRIWSYNLKVFDPTWVGLSADALQAKLRARAAAVSKPKVRAACEAYAGYLAVGGELAFDDLVPSLLTGILARGHPVLCGLNATYLYQQVRERPADNEDDDVAGYPVGHFLVACGHEAGERFHVRDPSSHVPFSPDGRYTVPAHRLINAILLGIVSYDAVLVELWPEESK